MKYRMSWTQKDGTKVKNQLYTAEHITDQLLRLESWGCTDITVEQVKELKTYYLEYRVNSDSYKYCTYITANSRDEAMEEFAEMEKDLKAICKCEIAC